MEPRRTAAKPWTPNCLPKQAQAEMDLILDLDFIAPPVYSDPQRPHNILVGRRKTRRIQETRVCRILICYIPCTIYHRPTSTIYRILYIIYICIYS